jgi:hypothetical protein
MKIQLTQTNGKPLIVDSNDWLFLEPGDDGVTTHIVFGAEFVRVVKEPIGAITALTGIEHPAVVPLAAAP